MLPLVTKVDYPALEQRILRFWDYQNVLRRLTIQNKNGEPWLFLDGPVTANNRLGVHHGWGRTYKDIFSRFQAMHGKKLRWQNGFDCQGLWVEVEVEKQNTWNTIGEIKEYMDVFVNQCQQRVDNYIKIITDQSRQLGQWMDWDKSYRTDSDNNIEHIWMFLQRCHERGLLIQGSRVQPWCPRCGTSLSQHELADSYAEQEDDAIYFKCDLIGYQSMLVWTTTPWTIPANTALAINPDAEYVCLRNIHPDKFVWMSRQCQLRLYPDYPNALIVERGKGSRLVNCQYNPPFGYYRQTTYKIIPWADVNPNEGSGIVHIAPGCGADDHRLGIKHNLRFIVPINERGVFYPGFGQFSGQSWDKVNNLVIILLKETGNLIQKETYKHRYPHCWRCHEELVYRLCNEWFIRTSSIRDELIAAAKTITWKPEYGLQHMLNWLENMGDWCISRNRFWGLPLPIYHCGHCGEITVVGSESHLEELATDVDKFHALQHLHRPYIDEIKIFCPKCGQQVERIKQVGDCWLDAGIVPFSTTGYLTKGANDFPNDFVTEMREQIRLWFYSTLVMSVIMEKKAPFKTVLTYEEMRDKNGERFSKTKGNAPVLDEIIKAEGADPLRLVFALAPTNTPFSFSIEPIIQAKRKLIVLWNCYSYFAQYYNKDKPALGLPDFNEFDALDRWILAQLFVVSQGMERALQDYDAQKAATLLMEFIDELSNWYIRLKRPVFNGPNNKCKENSYKTLWTVLRDFPAMIAPILPFTAEELHQNYLLPLDTELPVSVHLRSWPKVDGYQNDALLIDMKLTQAIVQSGLGLRNKAKIKIRQPLSSLFLVGDDIENELLELIKQEVNVLDVRCFKEMPVGGIIECECHHLRVGLDTNFSLELLRLGTIRDIVRGIQSLRKKMGMVAGQEAFAFYVGCNSSQGFIEGHRKSIQAKTNTVCISPINKIVPAKPTVKVKIFSDEVEFILSKVVK